MLLKAKYEPEAFRLWVLEGEAHHEKDFHAWGNNPNGKGYKTALNLENEIKKHPNRFTSDAECVAVNVQRLAKDLAISGYHAANASIAKHDIGPNAPHNLDSPGGKKRLKEIEEKLKDAAKKKK